MRAAVRVASGSSWGWLLLLGTLQTVAVVVWALLPGHAALATVAPWCVLVDLGVLAAAIGARRFRTRAPRRAVVIGDVEFGQRLREVASRHGHRVVASWSADRSVLATLDAAMPHHDVLVVQAERIACVADIPDAGRPRPNLVALSGADVLDPRTGSFTRSLPLAARAFKRCVDVVIASTGLLLTGPIILATAIAVRVDSPGGAFFTQVRVGRDGRRFRCYKLRTMTANNDDSEWAAYAAAVITGEADPHSGMYKLVGDPRVTRVGRLLRRFSVDELPQLWNIVRGDMSIVGPRPPLPQEVERYDGTALQRLRVKPGLTGLWQVSGRCELTFAEMVALDNDYWRRWSPQLDLRIILRTPFAVLRGPGAA